MEHDRYPIFARANSLCYTVEHCRINRANPRNFVIQLALITAALEIPDIVGPNNHVALLTKHPNSAFCGSRVDALFHDIVLEHELVLPVVIASSHWDRLQKHPHNIDMSVLRRLPTPSEIENFCFPPYL